MKSSAKDMVETYMKCVDRLEKDICAMDQDGTITSIAISLKRIADTLEQIEMTLRGKTNG